MTTPNKLAAAMPGGKTEVLARLLSTAHTLGLEFVWM